MARRVAPAAGETIVCAVSGGPDSVALAALAARAAERAGAAVVLGHVNHALRESAWQDEAVVLAVGAALGVRVLATSLAPGSAGEERLRDERYAALARLAERAGARRILCAHHARDQAETVLLALLRGTGPAGLAGMPAVRPLEPGLELGRPLLDIEPERLASYCAAEHLPYAVDPTNSDLGYRRNAVRSALAELRASFPHLDAAVARCAEIVRAERAGDARARLRQEIRSALAAAGTGTRDVTFERLESAAQALERRGSGRHFLRHGVELLVE